MGYLYLFPFAMLIIFYQFDQNNEFWLNKRLKNFFNKLVTVQLILYKNFAAEEFYEALPNQICNDYQAPEIHIARSSSLQFSQITWITSPTRKA